MYITKYLYDKKINFKHRLCIMSYFSFNFSKTYNNISWYKTTKQINFTRRSSTGPDVCYEIGFFEYT